MLIVDAGPLYAAADRRDAEHERCREFLAAAARPLVVPHLVIAEVAHLLASRLGPRAELALAESLMAGELLVEPVLETEWARIHELMAAYLDLPLGMADASLVVLAERCQADTVASLDLRHLAVVRPAHVPALTLVP